MPRSRPEVEVQEEHHFSADTLRVPSKCGHLGGLPVPSLLKARSLVSAGEARCWVQENTKSLCPPGVECWVAAWPTRVVPKLSWAASKSACVPPSETVLHLGCGPLEFLKPRMTLTCRQVWDPLALRRPRTLLGRSLLTSHFWWVLDPNHQG